MKLLYRHIARVAFLAVALVGVTACGGGGSTPPPQTYSIGGTVSGLDRGESVVLQNNGGDDLTVSANSTFTFPTKVTSGSAYAVIASPPTGKTCTVTGGSGTVSSNITGVAVACVPTPTFSIGGSVSGLVGQGLELALLAPRRSGQHVIYDVTVDTIGINNNGKFAFQSPQVSGEYLVGIKTQPNAPTQRCVVRNPWFALATANITDLAIACGEFAYVTNAANNTISAFSVDATTGAIALVGSPVATGLSPSAIASTFDTSHLYVANGGSNDVSVFAVDAVSGTLTIVPGSPFAVGTNPRAVAFWNSWLYVANTGSNDISTYGLDPSTGLPGWSITTSAVGSGPSAIVIADGGLLYAANTGGSSDISAFVAYVDPMQPITGSPFPSGGSVSSFAFGPGQKTLYAANASGAAAAIYGFSIDPASGALASLAGFPHPLPSCTYIVVEQTGTYLYATAGTDVLGYRIDANTGALSPLSGFPVAVGANASSVSIDPANQFLYVANGSAGTVTVFKLNGATGALTPVPGSPFVVGKSADYIATL